MKASSKNKILFIVLLISTSVPVCAQNGEKPELLVDVSLVSAANSPSYVSAMTRMKLGKKFSPAPNIYVDFYIDSITSPFGSTISDKKGLGKIYLPVAMKSQWEGSATHKLIAVSKPTKSFESVTAELDVTKSKLQLDTIQGEARTISATVMELNMNKWVPAKDVEVKIMIRRLGADLPIGDEENYTTDSTGQVIVEFKRQNLPGDEKGNLTFIAKIDQNDRFGTVTTERILPWGVATRQNESLFNARTLYATGDRAPVWLLLFAGSIIAIVWGSIIYLIYLLIKIKRANNGKQAIQDI